MKLTVYDKSNSHPALTYKGKRIITVCRDGSMYLSKILSRELKLHAGNRLGIARDDDRPKDWYMFVSDDENGFMIWNDPRCARFSNSFIAGMILDAAKVEKCAGFMVAREPVIFTMCIAFFVIHGADPFAVKELALVYLAIFVLMYIAGPGNYSVDRLIAKKIGGGK